MLGSGWGLLGRVMAVMLVVGKGRKVNCMNEELSSSQLPSNSLTGALTRQLPSGIDENL